MRQLIALAFLGFFLSQTPAQADHILVYVDQNGPGPGTGTFQDPFLTITAAINYAFQHDFILVRPGTYNEEITIPFFVFLRSTEGPEVTTINATGLPGTHAVTMDALTELIGFTVRNDDGAGVLVEVPGGASGAPEYGRIIRGNRILGCPNGGIHLTGPCHPFMVENLIANCGTFGLKLEEAASPWFCSNTVVNCAVGLWKAGVPPDPQVQFGNNIVWGGGTTLQGFVPADISHSILNDPSFHGQNGNLAQDPLFMLTHPFDFRLSDGSPAVDTANNLLVAYSSVFDIRNNGFLRRADGDHDGLLETDRGAFERGGLDTSQLGLGLGSTFQVEIDTGPNTQWLLAAGTFNLNPVPLPGATGYLFLEDWSLVLLTTGVQPTTLPVVLSFPVTDPSALGFRLPIQAIGLNPALPAPNWALTSAPLAAIN